MRYFYLTLSFVCLNAFSQSDLQDPNYVNKVSNSVIDLSQIKLGDRAKTNTQILGIWDEFRKTHSMDEEGNFVDIQESEITPDNKYTQNAFLYYIKSKPIVVLSATSEAGCASCAGRGTQTRIVKTPGGNQLGDLKDVPCGVCKGKGVIRIYSYTKFIAGALPQRIKPAALTTKSAELINTNHIFSDSGKSFKTIEMDLDQVQIRKIDNVGIVSFERGWPLVNVNDFFPDGKGGVVVRLAGSANGRLPVRSDLATKIWNQFTKENRINNDGVFAGVNGSTSTQDSCIPQTILKFKEYIKSKNEVLSLATGDKEQCKTCSGKGSYVKSIACPSCNGGGFVHVAEIGRDVYCRLCNRSGGLTQSVACDECNGKGSLEVVGKFRLCFSGLLIRFTEKLSIDDFKNQEKVDSVFDNKYDAFEKTTKYLHRTFLDLEYYVKNDYTKHFPCLEHKAYLNATVKTSIDPLIPTSVFIQSNYNDDKRVFHDRFKLSIGNEVLESSIVQNDKVRPKQEVSGKGLAVREVCTFPTSESFNIIEKIAKRKPGEVVSFRLIGKDYYADRELTEAELIAFDDVYNFISFHNKNSAKNLQDEIETKKGGK